MSTRLISVYNRTTTTIAVVTGDGIELLQLFPDELRFLSVNDVEFYNVFDVHTRMMVEHPKIGRLIPSCWKIEASLLFIPKPIRPGLVNRLERQTAAARDEDLSLSPCIVVAVGVLIVVVFAFII